MNVIKMFLYQNKPIQLIHTLFKNLTIFLLANNVLLIQEISSENQLPEVATCRKMNYPKNILD